MALELFNLKGKKALITGSGRGIGLTLARGLGNAGAEIIINDIDQERIENAVESLAAEDISAANKTSSQGLVLFSSSWVIA